MRMFWGLLLLGCMLSACTRELRKQDFATVVPVLTSTESGLCVGSGILVGEAPDRLDYLMLTSHQLGRETMQLRVNGVLVNCSVVEQGGESDDFALLHLSSAFRIAPEDAFRVCYHFNPTELRDGERLYLQGYPVPEAFGDNDDCRRLRRLAAYPVSLPAAPSSFVQFFVDPEPQQAPFGMSGGALLLVPGHGQPCVVGVFVGQTHLANVGDRNRRILSAHLVGCR